MPAAELEAIWVRSREASLTALRLNPELAEARAARGRVLQTADRDLVSSEVALRHALEVAPQDAHAMRWLAVVLAQQGRFEEGIALTQRAKTFDPLSASIRYNLSLYFCAAGRYEQAEAALREALELQPQGAQFHAYLAVAQLLRGNAKGAIDSAKQEPDEFWRNWALTLAHFAHGDQGDSDAALAWLIKNDSEDAAVQIAAVYAQRKQPDEMFRWLDRAVATNDPGINDLYDSPYLINYRDDPRYAVLAKKIGLPPLPAGEKGTTAPAPSTMKPAPMPATRAKR